MCGGGTANILVEGHSRSCNQVTIEEAKRKSKEEIDACGGREHADSVCS